MANFNGQLRIMAARLNVCLCLKTAFYGSTKAKRVDKDRKKIFAHCEKCSKDSVEQAGLCKLFFFSI